MLGIEETKGFLRSVKVKRDVMKGHANQKKEFDFYRKAYRLFLMRR